MLPVNGLVGGTVLFSILAKKQTEPVKIEDTNLDYQENKLYANVIIDGKIMHHNLTSLGYDENWLKRKLKETHASAIPQILLAIASSDNDLITFDKNQTLKHHDYFI